MKRMYADLYIDIQLKVLLLLYTVEHHLQATITREKQAEETYAEENKFHWCCRTMAVIDERP